MADITQLESALVKADAAGDTEGARVLAGEIRRLRSAPAPAASSSGMLAPGNIDLTKRPRVKNPDGSISTVRSLGINDGQSEVLIPTVHPDGYIMSDDDAVAHYRKTGQHLGRFTTPDASETYAQQLHEDQAKMYAPQERSAVSDFFGGLKKAGTDTVLGVRQLAAMAGMGDEGALAKEAQMVKERDAALMDTTAGTIGNVVGQVGSMLIPGGALMKLGKVAPALSSLGKVGAAITAPKTLGGAAALGAATGAIQPAVNNDERVTNALLGGAGGAAGSAVATGIGRVLSPKTDEAVKALMNQGVTPTPGQIMGGTAKRVEDAATSLPILGDAIKARQQKVVSQFNDAALNKVLAPIGEKIGSKGREAIDEAAKKIGAAYDSVLPNIKLQADANYNNAITSLRGLVQNLPKSEADQFESIIKVHLNDKFTSSGLMSGQTFKEVESELGRLARGYMGDTSFDKRQLGSALREAQATLRNLMQQQNPGQAKQLKAANEAWANFTRVQDAAGRQGAKEGVFSPAQLSSAVRGQDKSLRHGAFAKGEAVMQDLSEAGQKVLSNTVPDSGTPYRSVIGLAAGGGLAAVEPVALGATLGASALYTQPAQKVIAALLTQRPDLARHLGNAFQSQAPRFALPGAAFANTQE